MGRAAAAAIGVWVAGAVWAEGTAPAGSAVPLPGTEDGRVIDGAAQRRFDTWVAAFRARALAQGIDAATFDRAFAGVQPIAEVIEKDRNQSEFTRPIWEYLDRAVSESRIREGLAALAEHRALLDRIEAEFGVEREVVVAIWGMESSYGSNRGAYPLIGSLATLACDGRRAAFFESQLVAALQILQSGDVAPEAMTGSWAGAMGHTQFMPTSYLAFAVDFTGDGKRDIWGEDPGDALASTAAYLAKSGWRFGQPWGIEVALPADFDHGLAGGRAAKPVSEWQALGLRGAGGGALPGHGPAAVVLPAGWRGAAFLVFDNFGAIERYNAADAYVIAVGHLADRLKGGPPIRAAWPRGDRALQAAERKELQQRLTRAGFDTRGADGLIGPNTIAALRAWQRASGLVPDGYASPEMLRLLR